MRAGDSRSLSGDTIRIGQDHRPNVDTDVRMQQVACRIVGRDTDGTPRYDEEAVGDVQGLSFWEPESDRRPTGSWRETRLCVVVGPNGYTGAGAGTGQDEPGAAWTPSGGMDDDFGGGGAAVTGGGGGVPVSGNAQPPANDWEVMNQILGGAVQIGVNELIWGGRL